MPISLQIQNFRILKDVTLDDPSAFSLIVGYNESGKSSLAGAIEYAMTGSAFGLRGKEASALIRRNETRLKVELRVGDLAINRTRTSGHALKDVAEMLDVDVNTVPLLFNQKLSIDGGAKAVRAFLETLSAAPLDLRAVLGKDQALLQLLDEAEKATNGTIKEIVSHAVGCRAACKKPAVPTKPAFPCPSAADGVAANEALAKLLAQQENDTQSNAKAETERDLLTRCRGYLEAKAEYDRKVATATDDSIGDKRAPLGRLAEVDTTAIATLVEALRAADHQELAKTGDAFLRDVEEAKSSASTQLRNSPPPKGAGKAPALSPETRARFDKLEHQTVDHVTELLDRVATELKNAEASTTALTAQIADARTAADRTNQQIAAWAAYREAAANHTTECDRADGRWAAWDNLVKAIEAALGERQQNAASQFLRTVSDFARSILQNRELTVTEEGEMLLDGLPISTLSESTTWRVSICVMAAVARHSKSPLLVLDGADVLDGRNRPALMDFLRQEIVPHFRHVILLATARESLGVEKPFDPKIGITKWLLDEGQLARCLA